MKKLIPMVFDINQLEQLANNKNSFACYILGRSYDNGENNVEQNYDKAFYWYNKGKELNDPRCIYGVAACYYFGDGVKKNLNKAYDLFVEAYQPLLELIKEEKTEPHKQAFSIFCLGAYYYFGFGNIKENKNKAFQLII